MRGPANHVRSGGLPTCRSAGQTEIGGLPHVRMSRSARDQRSTPKQTAEPNTVGPVFHGQTPVRAALAAAGGTRSHACLRSNGFAAILIKIQDGLTEGTPL